MSHEIVLKVAQKLGMLGPLAGVFGRHIEMNFVERPKEVYISIKEMDASISSTGTLSEKNFTTHPMEGMYEQRRSDRATISSHR